MRAFPEARQNGRCAPTSDHSARIRFGRLRTITAGIESDLSIERIANADSERAAHPAASVGLRPPTACIYDYCLGSQGVDWLAQTLDGQAELNAWL